MTCLEHLIENTLCNFKQNKSADEIKEGIRKDINLNNAGITPEQCWEICQYVWCDFIAYNYEPVEQEGVYIE